MQPKFKPLSASAASPSAVNFNFIMDANPITPFPDISHPYFPEPNGFSRVVAAFPLARIAFHEDFQLRHGKHLCPNGF